MKVLFYFTLLILFLSSCEKIPFDHRNKYLGDYKFSYSYYNWNITPYQSPTVTEESIGEVYYDKKEDKDLIIIKVSESLIFNCDINENGILNICGGSGEFENKNKLTLQYSSSSCPGNGMGGGVVYSIIGNKD